MQSIKVKLTTTPLTVNRKVFDDLGLTEKFDRECVDKSPAKFHVGLFPDEKFVTISAELSLKGTNNAVANMLRAIICSELPVRGLWAQDSSCTTTDEFLIPEEVARRVSMVPLHQSCPPDAKFQINVANPSAESVYVTTAHLEQIVGRRGNYFDKNFCLFKLDAGKAFTMKNIGTIVSAGDIVGMGMFAAAHGVGSFVDLEGLTEDEQPLNLYTKRGVPACHQNYRNWIVKFRTNGTIEPKELLVAACKNAVDRIKNVASKISVAAEVDDELRLDVPAETSSMGNMFVKVAVERDQECTITYNVGRNGTLTIVTKAADARKLLREVAADLVATFDAIADGL